MKNDGMRFSQAGTATSVEPRLALLCLLILALALTALRIPVAVSNPCFSGDEAHRMHMAAFPAIRLDNRVWLPVLQVHIWLLYRFHAPAYAFRLVPCFYYFLSLVLLGALSLKHLGRGRLGLALSLALVAICASQGMVTSLGASLMQEIIELPLLLLLLLGGALELKKKWWLLPASAFALLTRDTFWICLFVVTLLNWRKILSDRTYIYSFLVLWSVPVCWLLMTPVGHFLADGRWPAFPTRWPLGINKSGNHAVSDLSRSLPSVWTALTTTRVVHFAAILFLVGIGLQFCRRKSGDTSRASDDFASRFAPFSLLSLFLTYSLFILLDPWQATFGDSRMSTPLLFHGLIWAVVLIRQSLVCPGAMKYVAVAVILAGMVTSTTIAKEAWFPKDYTQVNRVYGEIERDLSRVAQIGELRVCIVDADYFSALHALVKPTLYAKRRVVLRSAKTQPQNCDVVFARMGSEYLPGEGFDKYKDYVIDGRAYALFVSQRRRGS
jgi:hypothetical protein